MNNEREFAEIALNLIQVQLAGKPLEMRRGAALLYKVTVDNHLRVMPPDQIRAPIRGDSAFETDLCLFELIPEGISHPRVVLELKTSLTTHDVLTYSAKAEKHKTIYPYLRYGMVLSSCRHVPRRFYTHNEEMDFYLCLGGLAHEEISSAFADLVEAELECSRSWEQAAYGERNSRLFRNKIILK